MPIINRNIKVRMAKNISNLAHIILHNLKPVEELYQTHRRNDKPLKITKMQLKISENFPEFIGKIPTIRIFLLHIVISCTNFYVFLSVGFNAAKIRSL